MSATDKIVTVEELPSRVRSLREAGSSIALANGLFDILHVGHLRYLEGAAREADLLVVAVNSDRTARRLKGAGRPMTPEAERAELIAGFSCVDLVTVFDTDTVEPVLRGILPDVHCKGTDYTAETVPEAHIAQELGVRIAIVGDRKAHSSRDVIAKLKG